MRTALHHRVARLEAEAARATTPTVGAMIVDVLERRAQRPSVSDTELAKSATGRLLLQRRQRAEANSQG
jgi:hypothetical protein